ncbi:MAG: hypothetical protein LUI02_04915 [Clostridiales bacterium]|nr:hypothetical protein [Clostridiales bacterium]
MKFGEHLRPLKILGRGSEPAKSTVYQPLMILGRGSRPNVVGDGFVVRDALSAHKSLAETLAA